MKLAGVSTHSFSQTLRFSLLRAQAELAKAQTEVTTGRLADPGLALGAQTSRTVSLARDLERTRNILDTNALASARLSATQESLGELGERAQAFLSTLTTAAGGDVGGAVLRRDAETTLEAMRAILNGAFNGEHLFAGTNTDVEPIGAWEAGSPAKSAFDAAFQAHFGFAQTDGAAADITGPDMEAFLLAAEPQFLGPGWSNLSSAADSPIVSRIALGETAPTSVSANAPGVRKLAMAAATVFDLLGGPLGAAGREAVVERALGLVGEAISELGGLQAETGLLETRVARASERLQASADLFERHIGELEGVDPYEASTRVQTLLAQIETSYALTARIGELSLMRFLS